MLGLERFAEAADRLGYIVVSSYDTRSDSTKDVNVQAINAMLRSIAAQLAEILDKREAPREGPWEGGADADDQEDRRR